MTGRRVLAVLAAAAALILGACSASGSVSTGSESRPVGTQVGTAGPPTTGGTAVYRAITGAPPWPAPATGVSARAAAAGLPMLPQEALTEHIHAHLDVFYDGQPVTVPALIGIDGIAQAISPLHTHDTSGIVHIESPEVKPYYVGQFFTEWGVQIGSGCVAGQCPPTRPVATYVNGSPVSTPVDQVEFHAHDEIAVVIGAPPDPVPSSYSFPAGY